MVARRRRRRAHGVRRHHHGGLYGMRLMKSAGYGKRRKRGHGFFNSIWNGIKKANNFLKDNKIISGALSQLNPKYAAAAANAGYGRRRRRRRSYGKRRGRGISRLVY